MANCSSDEICYLNGDFNCTECDDLDRNHVEPHAASKHAMAQLVKGQTLVDMWRELHPTERQYTWTHCRENVISLARLDRMYCFRHHFNMVKRCIIAPVGFSDHSMVICDVCVPNITHKSAYWHFNNALLVDENFRDVFIFFWKDFRSRKAEFISLRQWWDCGKIEIRQLCQQYTQGITRTIIRSMNDLEMEIVELQSNVGSTGDRGQFEVLKLKRSALADLLGSRAQGALVRSRFQSAALMDSPSKFFFGLEKKNGQSRQIHGLHSKTGRLLMEPSAVRQRAVEFYSELFTSEYEEDEESFESFCDGLSQLPEVVSMEVEGPLHREELWAALQSMEGGRAPGIDGLSVEFFRAFWPEMCEDILGVFNESFEQQFLPRSCRRAVLTLLPKKGDLQEIKNWRPVSLLCVDYKMLSKALANRLKRVIEYIIHRDQTYCVPGRSIFDNVFLIRDILEVSSSFGLDAGLLSLDQEKAFDRVEHQYLWKLMERFGLSPGFIAMIKVMYEDAESVLKINGELSRPFKVCRGIRQGCSMSGMLYAISIEPLLHKIRSCISGVVVPMVETRYVLSAYADDLIVFIQKQVEIDKLGKIVTDFGRLSSARVNWGKSEALAVGSWLSGLPSLPAGMTWKRDGLKYLGIYLGAKEITKKNWDGVLDKVRAKLNKWRWLLPQMSYRGRALVINNLVSSTLWHKIACMEPPAGLLQEVQSVLVDFFWDKLHWVSQSVLFLTKEEGGHGLVHLLSRLTTFRLQFVQRYLMGTNVVWRDLASAILRRTANLGLDASLFLLDSRQIGLADLPRFYQGLFRAWNVFKWSRLEPTSSLFWLLEEPLVHGSRMDIQDRTAPGLNRRLCDTGHVKLKHIVEAAGPGFLNTGAVASLLGLRSHRYTRHILNSWMKELTTEEIGMLRDYSGDLETLDQGDPFPELGFSVCLDGLKGPLLELKYVEDGDFYMSNGKQVYRYCVKALNKKKLDGKNDSVWRDKLNVDRNVVPVWRVLYKAPLRKRSGDLQWRILHGALAVNVFLAKLNPAVSCKCPFCDESETVFHCFAGCRRLEPLFEMLNVLFQEFGCEWSITRFIFGAGYRRQDAKKWQLVNFIVGTAKFSIYKSRKNTIDNVSCPDLVPLFVILVKARVWVDFRFHKAMNSLGEFWEMWCYEDIICSLDDVEDGKLMFSTAFL